MTHSLPQHLSQLLRLALGLEVTPDPGVQMPGLMRFERGDDAVLPGSVPFRAAIKESAAEGGYGMDPATAFGRQMNTAAITAIWCSTQSQYPKRVSSSPLKPRASISSFTATAASAEPAPNKLCPHPWPGAPIRSGS